MSRDLPKATQQVAELCAGTGAGVGKGRGRSGVKGLLMPGCPLCPRLSCPGNATSLGKLQDHPGHSLPRTFHSVNQTRPRVPSSPAAPPCPSSGMQTPPHIPPARLPHAPAPSDTQALSLLIETHRGIGVPRTQSPPMVTSCGTPVQTSTRIWTWVQWRRRASHQGEDPCVPPTST